MRKRITLFVAIVIVACGGGPAVGLPPGEPTPEDWVLGIRTSQDDWGFLIGAKPGWADGYDGQPPFDLESREGIAILLYRATGPAWSGPTGFYMHDYESPIPPGESKTWSDIYLWAQNRTPPQGDRADVQTRPFKPYPFYTCELVLDYVPEHLNWDGPTRFEFDMRTFYRFTLPVPVVTDPLDGTRMHLTVYAPIPEPCSLSTLGFGVLLVARLGLRVRRRE